MAKNLEEKIVAAGGPVNMLRTSQLGQYVFPVPLEFSNWRDETAAWNQSAVLLDQSHHMTDLYVKGPDTIKLLSDLSINSFNGFRRNKAKQMVCCNYDGYVIGDAILFALEDDHVNIVGRPHVANWVQFHATTGNYDVELDRDERSLANKGVRKTFRFEVQGPNAWALLEKANGGPIDDIKFFNMGEVNIGKHRVRCLKHGMAAAPGLELFGPWEIAEEIRGTLLEVGKAFGLLQGGARAYSTASTESGWLASVLPAIYSGEKMKPYREWLGANCWESVTSLGGSFISDNIEDYYLTPWDIGYNFIKFDHDFIGREALEKKQNNRHLKKVTILWDNDDVTRVFQSQFNQGDQRFKFMDTPAAYYATFPFDTVLKNGKRVGLSTYVVYSNNARRYISLAMVEPEYAQEGTELSVLWGEPNSKRPVVEAHRMTEVKGTVTASPLPLQSREGYRDHSLTER